MWLARPARLAWLAAFDFARYGSVFFVSGHMSDARHSLAELAYMNPRPSLSTSEPCPPQKDFGDSTRLPQELLYAGSSGGEGLLIGGSVCMPRACAQGVGGLGRMAWGKLSTRPSQLHVHVYDHTDTEYGHTTVVCRLRLGGRGGIREHMLDRHTERTSPLPCLLPLGLSPYGASWR